MLDLIVLNSQACATGTCPQAIVTASYVLAPQVVAAAPLLPGKTKVVTQYKRNLFGKLVPSYSTVTTSIAATQAVESKGTCKGGCK